VVAAVNESRVLGRLALPYFWIGAIVIADLAIGVPLSLPAAVLVLWLLPLLYRAAWWHPLVPAAGFLVAAPAAVASGVGKGVDSYAVLGLALVGLSLVLLAVGERRRLQSADG
jgi:hypothetical protein